MTIDAVAPVPAAVEIDAVALLQERLGISYEEAVDFGNIAVACPVPGVDGESTFKDFLESEHGASKAATIMDTAAEEQRDGAAPEKALARALGFAAIKDPETGALRRVEPTEDGADPKKKTPTPNY